MDSILPEYPGAIEVDIGLRPFLHPALRALRPEVSEFTFANIYLFRDAHAYRLSRLPDSTIIITGRDGDRSFFMCPSGLLAVDVVSGLLKDFDFARCVEEKEGRGVGEKARERRRKALPVTALPWRWRGRRPTWRRLR